MDPPSGHPWAGRDWDSMSAIFAADFDRIQRAGTMAGPGNNPVQVLSTGLSLHWEFLRLRAGFELPSSWNVVPCYGTNLNRNILDFMRWSQIDLGAQDLNDIQRPKSFQKNSWK
jgi:hypothetical protein